MTTITTRSGKGSALTNTELDTNFTNLNTAKLELGQAQSSGTANGILYLDGSKQPASNSGLTFNGSTTAITANSTSAALTITQDGTGHALVVNDVTGDTTPFVINANGDVGIGTSPAKPAGFASFLAIGDSDTGVGQISDGVLAFSTNNAERLRIGTDGTMTIAGSVTQNTGTTFTTGGNVTVRSPDGVEGGQITLNNKANTSAAYNFDVDASDHGRLFTTQNNTNLTIGQVVGTGGIIALYTGATERMRIDNLGNILINSTAILESYGRVGVRINGGSEGGLLELSDTAGSHSIIYRNTALNQLTLDARSPNSGIGYEAKGTGVHSFVANGTERMRIDSAGNMGIGTAPYTTGSVFSKTLNGLHYFDIRNDSATAVSDGVVSRLITDSVAGGSSSTFDIIKRKSGEVAFNHSETNAAAYVRFNIGGTERMRIDSAGNVGIGSGTVAGQSFRLARSITGATSAYGFVNQPAIQSDVTGVAILNYSGLSTQAASFTVSGVKHFDAAQDSIGAGSTVTSQYGFVAESSLTGATNNYGFYGGIASGTGRYNFYAAGTADNYFAGRVGVGVSPTYTLDVAGQVNLGGTTVDGSSVEINANGSGNRYAYIDFHGDDTYADYSLRLIRENTGANADSVITHKGTGALALRTEEAGNIVFQTNGTERMRIGADGTGHYSGGLFNITGLFSTNYYALGFNGRYLRKYSVTNSIEIVNQANTQVTHIFGDDGALTVNQPAGLGYGTGSGGTVTQATSKSTTVTLNKPTGQITMNNAALAAGASVSFTLNNSLIATTDTLIVNVLWGTSDPSKYIVRAGAGTGGTALIVVKNDTAGSLSEAVVINFAIIKGATA